VEHRRLRRRLRAVAGQNQLGRAQTRRPDDVLARLDSPGITLRRIKQVNGSTEFCEEFFDDLELSGRCGGRRVDKGWEVASRQLYHEATRRRRRLGIRQRQRRRRTTRSRRPDYHAMIRAAGLPDNERASGLAGRALTHRAVWEQLIDHVYRAYWMDPSPRRAVR